MTLFGWFMVAVLSLMTINSERAGRWFSLGMLLGVLVFGTGTGV